MQQGGGDVPIFQGYRGQRGHGIGSVLAGLFRSAVPILKKGLSFFLPEALKTGAKIANDVADGQSFGEAAKKRVTERINEAVPGLIPQSGSGRRRRRYKRLNSIHKRGKRSRRDILD